MYRVNDLLILYVNVHSPKSFGRLKLFGWVVCDITIVVQWWEVMKVTSLISVAGED